MSESAECSLLSHKQQDHPFSLPLTYGTGKDFVEPTKCCGDPQVIYLSVLVRKYFCPVVYLNSSACSVTTG